RTPAPRRAESGLLSPSRDAAWSPPSLQTLAPLRTHIIIPFSWFILSLPHLSGSSRASPYEDATSLSDTNRRHLSWESPQCVTPRPPSSLGRHELAAVSSSPARTDSSAARWLVSWPRARMSS